MDGCRGPHAAERGIVGQVLNVRSHGVDEVEQTWRRFVPSAKLERVDPRRVGFTWSSVELPQFSVVAYDLRASVRASIHMEDQLMVCRITGPDVRVDSRGRSLDPRQPWLGVDGTTEASWTGTAQVRAFVFDRSHVEEVARIASGDDRLVLRAIDASARDRVLGAQWERSFAYVSASLVTAHEDPIAAAELQRHALLSTLSTFNTSYLEAMDRATQRTAAPRTVRRALAYIEENAREPLTLEDIARAAGISSRGLQHAFQRALGTSPTAQLRAVRLAGAHAELRAGTPQTVAEVARRWGFSSASRFARYYRENYGRNPGQTARMF